jgi:uncharacterized protein (TIGR03435 family)
MKKTILLVSVVVLMVAAVVAVKMIFFPSVSDDFFQLNANKLKQAPAGVVILRATHFPKSTRNGVIMTSSNLKGKTIQRIMGRNVSLQQVIITAYGGDLSRVVLPTDAPKTNFDFLVAVPDDPGGHLKTAIRKKLGLVAHNETRDTDVLALKVVDANPPGLKAGPANEKPDIAPKGGQLVFTHQKLNVITDGLGQMLKIPVVDKTGLNDFYDFSLVWDTKMQQALGGGALDKEAGAKILAGWGLGLEPDTAPMDVLVVEKAK